MTTAAPLQNVSVEAVHITRKHSSVVLLADESTELDQWLWGTDEIFRGMATGNRFRLTIDGVAMDFRRVFAKFCHRQPGMFVIVTSWPGETAASVYGRKVGTQPREVTLVRTAATRKQGELTPKAAGPKRVTVESPPE